MEWMIVWNHQICLHLDFTKNPDHCTIILYHSIDRRKARNTGCEMTADLCEKRLHFMYWRKICRIFLLFHRSTFQNVLVFFSQICCHFQPCISRLSNFEKVILALPGCMTVCTWEIFGLDCSPMCTATVSGRVLSYVHCDQTSLLGHETR